MKTIKIEITDRDSISSVCAKACLSAAAQYAEENGLVTTPWFYCPYGERK